MYVCMHVCMYVCVNVCNVCMYVCMYVCTYRYEGPRRRFLHLLGPWWNGSMIYRQA